MSGILSQEVVVKTSGRFFSEVFFGLSISDLSVNFIADVCVWTAEGLYPLCSSLLEN